MSSHREAPEISKDPAADNTDVYAFVTPQAPDTVTIVANYIPFQIPFGGPNFAEFADDVLYEIKISNAGDAQADITYQFRFTTTIRNPNTFLYNTGQINNITDTTWNRPQTYSVTKVTRDGRSSVLGSNFPVPPCNVGRRSTPTYPLLARQAIVYNGGRRFFAGQRADPFWADLGSIFDLGGLRPLNPNHLIPLPVMQGVNGLQGLNVHSIVMRVPISELTVGNVTGTVIGDPRSVIGVWATASRARSRVWNDTTGTYDESGGYVQVSRLGNPLFNEVIVPMAEKDKWNASPPSGDSAYAQRVLNPELAGLLPTLYPGAFPNLAAYNKPRNDLAAILLTGIPSGIVGGGFQNYTGSTQADMLRLNVAVPPSSNPNEMGILGGDLAGFPNGRRLSDNVTKIELQAVAGATIPLVDPSYTPDAVVSSVTDGSSMTNGPMLPNFPYVGDPGGGYQSLPGTLSVTNSMAKPMPAPKEG